MSERTIDVSDVNIKKEDAVPNSENTVAITLTKALLEYAFGFIGIMD